MAHSKHNSRTDPAQARYRSEDHRTRNKLRRIRKSNGSQGEREAQKWIASQK